MIDAVLITEFKLRQTLFAFIFLAGIKFIEVFEITRAFIIAAFVDSKERFLFPEVERIVAVGAPEGCFGLPFVFADLREGAADFATDLRLKNAIVVVEEAMWGVAARAFDVFWDEKLLRLMRDRF